MKASVQDINPHAHIANMSSCLYLNRSLPLVVSFQGPTVSYCQTTCNPKLSFLLGACIILCLKSESARIKIDYKPKERRSETKGNRNMFK